MQVNGQIRSDRSTDSEEDALHAAAQSELADRRAFPALADIPQRLKVDDYRQLETVARLPVAASRSKGGARRCDTFNC
jgi:hypothetical protein